MSTASAAAPSAATTSPVLDGYSRPAGWESISAVKELEIEPFCRSFFLRGLWRLYMQRLAQPGRWFLWVTVLFISYGGSSLDLQAYVPLCYVLGLWLTACLGWLLFRPRVDLRVNFPGKVTAGEILTVELEAVGQSRIRPTDLSIVPHRLPAAIDLIPENGAEIRCPGPDERVRGQIGLRCWRRGYYRLPGFRVETVFPLGLLRSSRLIRGERSILVFPRFQRLARLEMSAGRLYQPGGVSQASSLGDSFEYIGNREYREGDSIRDIDWRATARLQKPIVREYREEYFLRTAVILDTHLPELKGSAPRKALAAAQENLERAISLGAAVTDYMAEQEYIVDLFAAGPNLYHLMAGRSIAYLDQVLEILACIEGNPEEPFAAIEPDIMQNLAQITTLICIFLDWSDSRRAFALRLREEGAGLKVVVVRDAPCTRDPGADFPVLGYIPVLSRRDFERGVVEL